MHRFTLALALVACSAAALAQPAPVSVSQPWARATVQGQRNGGAYLTLTATEPLALVGASSPVASATEVHEMKMDGDVMRMRALPSLELPAGKTVELKPGGLHVMLLGLKAPLAPNTSVPLTLTFRNPRGQESRLELQVPVSATPPAAAGSHTGHGQHKH